MLKDQFDQVFPHNSFVVVGKVVCGLRITRVCLQFPLLRGFRGGNVGLVSQFGGRLVQVGLQVGTRSRRPDRSSPDPRSR